MSERVIGLAHFSAIHLSPADLITFAAAAGFRAVGLRLFPAFAGAPCYTVRQGSQDAKELRLRMDDTGVEIFDIEFVVIDAGFQAATLLPVLEDAAALGARRLSVCGQDADRIRLIDNFAQLCATAARVGMSVDLENMGWRPVRRCADSTTVALATGANNAGVLVDALHFFRNGGILAEIDGTLPHLLGHAQLCDVRGPEPGTDADRIAEARGGRFAPGAGELDLAGLISKLPKQTRISVEVPSKDGQDVKEHLAALMRGARHVISQSENTKTVAET